MGDKAGRALWCDCRDVTGGATGGVELGRINSGHALWRDRRGDPVLTRFLG